MKKNLYLLSKNQLNDKKESKIYIFCNLSKWFYWRNEIYIWLKSGYIYLNCYRCCRRNRVHIGKWTIQTAFVLVSYKLSYLLLNPNIIWGNGIIMFFLLLFNSNGVLEIKSNRRRWVIKFINWMQWLSNYRQDKIRDNSSII
jgi:hypothetical protein